MRPSKLATLVPVAALAFLTPATAQTSAPTGFLRTICTKVKPGKGPELEKLFADTVLKAAENQVKEGKLLRFAFSRVVVPTGDAAQCDYIGSYLYATFPPEPSRENAEAAFTAAKAGSYAAFLDKYLTLGHTVRSDFWALRGSLGSASQGDFFYVNWLKVANNQAFMEIQMKYAAPMLEMRMKDGNRKGGATYTRIVPTGGDEKINAAVVEFYGSWAEVSKTPVPLADYLKKVDPNLAVQDFIDRRNKAATLVERSLYKVLLTVGAMPKPS